MLGNRKASKRELNYAFRRVLYDMMLAAKCVTSLSASANDYSATELRKVAGLMMARNLNDFFFVVKEHRHSDDIDVSDFLLVAWQPNSSAKLNKVVKTRINKIAGHIVASEPIPFKKDQEVCDIIRPLVETAHQFILACLKEAKAEYTRKAADYRRRLDGILPLLSLPKLPKR